jgi:PAS domain-containing protein
MKVPEPPTESGRDGAGLGEALAGLLEFTGATAGWVALAGADGRLTFPARRGAVPDAWLAVQCGRGGPWGFAVRDGPTLLNDLGPLPLGAPPPANLLTCPLAGPSARGHVVLANKPAGFTSHDGAVLQAAAHLMARQLPPAGQPPAAAFAPPPLWRRVLDRIGEGLLVIDEDGGLVHANAVWLEWTGFSAAELAGARAPFPFWVSDRDLPAAVARAGGPDPPLPFRRRDESLIWRRVRTAVEEVEGRRFTVAFLRPAEGAPDAPPAAAARPAADWLALVLQPGGVVAWWDARWEGLTGLAADDLRAVPCETVLDWLLPRQPDRDRAADWMQRPGRAGGQGVLHLLSRSGERPFLCTLLPAPGETAADRWLLLAGPEAPEAPRNDAPEAPRGPHARTTVVAEE